MKLITRKDGEIVSKVEIRNETAYIGRSKQNDLVLPNPKISRRHAKIHFEDGQWFLEDLRSDNGTRFRGDRILKINIRSGDRFSIGPFEIELESDLALRNEQATVTSYIEPSRYAIEEKPSSPPEPPPAPVVPPKPAESGSFMDAIAVAPTEEERAAKEKADSLRAFVEEHSKDRLEHAPQSESIHTVILDPDSSPSLAVIAPSDDSVKTVIERRIDGQSMARLVCLDQDHLGVEIEIKKPEVTFGNDEKSDIRITGEDIPTRKAILKSTDSTFVIETEDSTSGTYVDGVPVRRRELENHDIIQVGDSRFEFLIGDSKSQVKKPRVIERPSKATPWTRVEERLSDWRVLLATGAVLGAIGVFGLWVFSPNPSFPSKTAEPKADETTRVVLYHLTEAQRLIDEGKIDEAEVRVKIILGKIAPDNIDALKLLKKIQGVRLAEKERIQSEKQAQSEKQSEVERLLAEHNRLLEQRRFQEAKKLQEKIVSMENGSPAAGKTLKANAEQAERQALAEKKNRAELNKIYFQGVEEYEGGNLSQAQSLLKEVAQKNGHPYQTHAKKLLAGIERQLSGTLSADLKAARAKLKTDDALSGYETIVGLSKKYPGRKDVQSALSEAEKQMDAKAKEAYRQGLTLKEMAEDPAAAIDQFERVLRYVPNPNHEYHRKAKEQIQKLQLNP